MCALHTLDPILSTLYLFFSLVLTIVLGNKYYGLPFCILGGEVTCLRWQNQWKTYLFPDPRSLTLKLELLITIEHSSCVFLLFLFAGDIKQWERFGFIETSGCHHPGTFPFHWFGSMINDSYCFPLCLNYLWFCIFF